MRSLYHYNRGEEPWRTEYPETGNYRCHSAYSGRQQGDSFWKQNQYYTYEQPYESERNLGVYEAYEPGYGKYTLSERELEQYHRGLSEDRDVPPGESRQEVYQYQRSPYGRGYGYHPQREASRRNW